jgi:hypothetical protein
VDRPEAHERQLPQRRQRQFDAARAERGQPRHPDQAARGVEHQERQRQLDHERGDDAHPEVAAAQVEDDVEPRVAAEQGPGDQQEGDHDLAAAPEGPAGKREAGQLDDVEADPGEPPVRRPEVPVQGQHEDHDPGDEHDAGDRGEQGREPRAAPQVQVQQRVGIVNRGKHAGELAAFRHAQLPQFRLIDHSSVLPCWRGRIPRVVTSITWMTNSCTRMSVSARTRSTT